MTDKECAYSLFRHFRTYSAKIPSSVERPKWLNPGFLSAIEQRVVELLDNPPPDLYQRSMDLMADAHVFASSAEQRELSDFLESLAGDAQMRRALMVFSVALEEQHRLIHQFQSVVAELADILAEAERTNEANTDQEPIDVEAMRAAWEGATLALAAIERGESIPHEARRLMAQFSDIQ